MSRAVSAESIERAFELVAGAREFLNGPIGKLVPVQDEALAVVNEFSETLNLYDVWAADGETVSYGKKAPPLFSVRKLDADLQALGLRRRLNLYWWEPKERADVEVRPRYSLEREKNRQLICQQLRDAGLDMLAAQFSRAVACQPTLTPATVAEAYARVHTTN